MSGWAIAFWLIDRAIAFSKAQDSLYLQYLPTSESSHAAPTTATNLCSLSAANSKQALISCYAKDIYS